MAFGPELQGPRNCDLYHFISSVVEKVQVKIVQICGHAG